jgi:hypothetical protein
MFRPPRHKFLDAVDLVAQWQGWSPYQALVAVHRACLTTNGLATERPPGEHRRVIDPLRFEDVDLTWLEKPRFRGQDEPNFYDKDTTTIGCTPQ